MFLEKVIRFFFKVKVWRRMCSEDESLLNYTSEFVDYEVYIEFGNGRFG